jgi:Reverse transcriptase (RNA-dependent DNA polymerase)
MVSSARHVKEVKDELSRLYTIKDFGRAEYFFGIKLDRTSHGGIKLMQSQYVTSILERYGISASKPVSTPMSSITELMNKTAPNEEESRKMLGVPYREAIGMLMYLSVRSRPGIAVSVGILAKHVQNPRPIHWEAVKRVFRYLKRTVNDGLVTSGNDPTLSIFVDADWGSDPEDRCSRTGVV